MSSKNANTAQPHELDDERFMAFVVKAVKRAATTVVKVLREPPPPTGGPAAQTQTKSALVLFGIAAVCIVTAFTLDGFLDTGARLKCESGASGSAGASSIPDTRDCATIAEHWYTRVQFGAAKASSGMHGVAIGVKAILVFTSTICLFELMLMGLRRAGLSMDSSQAEGARENVLTDNGDGGDGKSGKGSKWSFLFTFARQIVLQPQFFVTALVGLSATTVVFVHELSAADNARIVYMAETLPSIKDDVTLVRSTLTRTDPAGKTIPVEPPTPALNARVATIDETTRDIRDKDPGPRLAELVSALGRIGDEVRKLTDQQAILARKLSRGDRVVSLAGGSSGEAPTNAPADTLLEVKSAVSTIKNDVTLVKTRLEATSDDVLKLRHTIGWIPCNAETSIASEIHRLVRLEDALTSRLSRTLAHDEMKKILDGRMPYRANTECPPQTSASAAIEP